MGILLLTWHILENISRVNNKRKPTYVPITYPNFETKYERLLEAVMMNSQKLLAIDTNLSEGQKQENLKHACIRLLCMCFLNFFIFKHVFQELSKVSERCNLTKNKTGLLRKTVCEENSPKDILLKSRI